MNSLAALAIKAVELEGYQHPLEPISQVGTYKLQQNSADGVVYATVNGGAWFPVWGAAGPVVTLQQAYDGGGAVGSGLGRAVATMTGGPVTLTNSAAVATGVLEVSKTPAAAQAGVGLTVVMGANATGGAVLVTAGNGTSKEVVWVADTATTLAGGGQRSLLLTRQATFATSQTQSRSLFSALSQPVLDDAGAGTQTLTLSSTLVQVLHQPTLTSGAGIVDTTAGLTIAMTPAAGAVVTGLTVTMGTLTANAGFAGRFIWNSPSGTAAGNAVVTIRTSANFATTGSLTFLQLSSAAANLTLGASLQGVIVDLQNFVTPGANAVTGLTLALPATTKADTALEGALVITSLATRERMIDCAVANTGAATGLWVLRWGTGTTLSAATTLVQLDANTNMTSAANQAVSGLVVTLGGGNAAGTDPSSASFCAKFDYRSVNGTAANNAIVNIECGAPRALGGQLVGLEVDLQANVTPGANAVIGQRILIPASSSASACGIVVTSTQTGAGSSGISVAMTPGGAASVRGITITQGANATGAGIFLTSASSTSTNVLLDVQVSPNSAQGARIFFWGSGAPTSVFATSTGTALNVASIPASGSGNYPNGAGNAAFCQIQELGTYTAATTLGSSATAIQSGELLLIRQAPTGPAGAVLTLNRALLFISHAPVNGGGGVTDTCVGVVVTMSPASAAAVTGASITMSANATGYGLLITHNRTTAAAGTAALRITGADEAVCIEMTDGDSVGVSAANEGRIIYNTTTQKFQISENGGAYANIV